MVRNWHRAAIADGCRRFIEPVSQRLCIKIILWGERIGVVKVVPTWQSGQRRQWRDNPKAPARARVKHLDGARFRLLPLARYRQFMSDTIARAEAYGSLLFAPEVPCVVISWRGFANSEKFRSLMNRGLELYIAQAARTQPLGWFTDTRGGQAVKPTDQEWMRTEWNTRAHYAGIRHVSFMVPETVFGQISVRSHPHNVAETNDYEIATSQHRTLQEAKNWLKAAIH